MILPERPLQSHSRSFEVLSVSFLSTTAGNCRLTQTSLCIIACYCTCQAECIKASQAQVQAHFLIAGEIASKSAARIRFSQFPSQRQRKFSSQRLAKAWQLQAHLSGERKKRPVSKKDCCKQFHRVNEPQTPAAKNSCERVHSST